MEVMPDWIEIIKGIVIDSQTSNIIKGILLFLVGIGSLLVKRWIKKQKIKAARAQTRQQRQDHQRQIDKETRVISQDAQQSETKVEDIINGE